MTLEEAALAHVHKREVRYTGRNNSRLAGATGFVTEVRPGAHVALDISYPVAVDFAAPACVIWCMPEHLELLVKEYQAPNMARRTPRRIRL